MTPDLSPATRRCLLLVLPALLAGCGTSPPVQLYRLRSDAPAPPPAAPATAEAVQLLLPVRVPDYLDREAILLPQGASGVLALSGHRWAESLRDAVPRVLLQDLRAHLGDGQVWTAPLPPGLQPARQLRVDILAFESDAERAGVRLNARWTWIDVQGRQPPQAASAQLRVAAAGSAIDSLVDAHRQALWQLAARIAAAR